MTYYEVLDPLQVSDVRASQRPDQKASLKDDLEPTRLGMYLLSLALRPMYDEGKEAVVDSSGVSIPAGDPQSAAVSQQFDHTNIPVPETAADMPVSS
ncbi:hypothetical protein HPB50_027460 [Hyalomma asiaticum]|uniref:Uncharacterized protein n=1 Tax=Hyalomma asiaticum TaxID=266040 RepID=A0ACB7S3D3_HYAAI|nr:hypothetical protein HPB50_027460 [Hyalomma asiaticum]